MIVAHTGLCNWDRPGTGQNLSFRQASVIDDLPPATLVAAVVLDHDERLKFRGYRRDVLLSAHGRVWLRDRICGITTYL